MSFGLGQMLIGGIIGSQLGKGGLLGSNEEDKTIKSMGEYNQPPTQVANNTNNTNQGFGGFGGIVSNVSNQMFKGMSQEQVARLGLGFNSMRLTPDTNLATSFRETIKTAEGKRNLNATVEQLKKMGKPNLAELVRTGAMPMATAMTLAFEKGASDTQSMISFMSTKTEEYPHFGDYIEILRANPEMLTEISKSVQKDLGLTPDSNFTIKTSAPKVMQTGDMAGHEYVVVTDPNKQGEDRVTIQYTGAILPTIDEEIKQKATADAYVADQELAKQMGFDAFNEAQSIEGQISMLTQALNEVIFVDDQGVEQFRDDGAMTGIIAKYLPASRAATAKFRTIANKLGISVINMATFGALSEREMQMAMRTNLDENLEGADLVLFIRESIEAKKKLATVLYERSLALSRGSGSYQEWQDETADKMVIHNNHRYEKLNESQIKGLQAIIDNPKNGYKPDMTTRDLWSRYNLDTRIAAMKGN